LAKVSKAMIPERIAPKKARLKLRFMQTFQSQIDSYTLSWDAGLLQINSKDFTGVIRRSGGVHKKGRTMVLPWFSLFERFRVF
jgi:hypothetical protein